MLKVKAKINLLNGLNSNINTISCNIPQNNVSLNIDRIKGLTTRAKNPFIIGFSKLGDGSTFNDSKNKGGNIDYYIGKVSANSNKIFETPYIFTINLKDIDYIILEFDNRFNRHPITINVNGSTEYCDRNICIIKNLNKNSNNIITIDNWNTEKAPLVLTGIYAYLDMNIDDSIYTQLSAVINSLKDRKFPEFGIISNGGNIEFNIGNSNFLYYLEKQLFNTNLDTEIILYNNINNKSEMLGKFKTENVNYDSDNHSINMTLIDDLIEWQDILVDNSQLNINKTMYDLYLILLDKTPEKYKIITTDVPAGEFIIDNTTKNILQSIVCEYLYFNKGSLWNEWQKMCETCGIYIYKNHNNNVVISYDFRS